MVSGYWEKVTQNRMSRRRALAGAGALGAGAAALSLAGCGGGGKNEGGGQPQDKSGLISQPVDTTARAKPGGLLKGFDSNDPPSMDPLTASAFQVTSAIAYYAYPRLLKWVTAKYPDSASGASEGDLAESFELSPDKLQLTLKIRPGVKWDARAPTNSRAADAQDVLFSWNKYASVNPLSQSIAYNATTAPGAPVESISAPDSRTVVVKLRQPDSSIVQLFTAGTLFYVLPREADGGFDPKGTVRGHGPYFLSEYRPSSIITWTKNPDYYVKGRPFFDTFEKPIVPEYATLLAQFKAGGVYYNPGVKQEDIVPTKKDVSALLLSQADNFSAAPPLFISFGYEGDSPFKDQRVRQAFAMLIDRETLADVFSNRPKFRQDGLEVPIRYHTTIASGWEGYWLDPLDEKAFGPNAKYLKFNLAEAKKLLDAAGFKNGIDTDFFYSNGLQYGADYPKICETYPGMLAEGAIKAKVNIKDYSSDYLPNYYWGYLQKDYISGKVRGFNGFLLGAERAYPTVASQLSATHHKDGDRFHAMTPDGKNPHLGDPKVNDLVDKIRVEFDLKKQQDLVHELVRYVAGMAYHLPATYGSKGFGLNWPVIGNLGVYRSYNASVPATETSLNWWLDTSQPPIGKGA